MMTGFTVSHLGSFIFCSPERDFSNMMNEIMNCSLSPEKRLRYYDYREREEFYNEDFLKIIKKYKIVFFSVEARSLSIKEEDDASSYRVTMYGGEDSP